MKSLRSLQHWESFIATHEGQVEMAVVDTLESTRDLMRVARTHPLELRKHREAIMNAKETLVDIMEIING